MKAMIHPWFARTKTIAVVLAALVLSACAALLPDRTVNITEAQVQQKLNEKLALPLTLLRVFDVSLTNPVVRFDGASERMHAQLDANVKSILGAPFAGKAAISGKLRFDAASRTVILVEPRIEQLNLGDTGGKYADLIALIAAKLGGELLKDMPLYTIKPEDLKVGNAQYLPKQMQITNQGLQVTLSPQ